MAVPAEPLAGSSMKSPETLRTIGEVSGDLSLPQSVLRFWETRFAQIKPMKRGGGSNSASLRFQMPCARSVAVFAPASVHWPKFDQSATSGS